MKKILAILLVFVMLFSLVACSGTSSDMEGGIIGGVINKGDSYLEAPKEDAAMPEGGDFDSALDGEIGEGGEEIEPSQKPNYTAGTLTAGEWSDIKNYDFWKTLLNRNDWYQLMENRKLFANKAIFVKATDGEQCPIYNLNVQLLNKDGDVVYEAVTNAFGEAVLLYNLNNNKETVTHIRFDGKKVELSDKHINEGLPVWLILTDEIMDIKELDLMLMVDTTGSMGDEITYLQKELENVINRVTQDNQALSIRVSVNFYRDEGDEYVIKHFDFTSDIKTAVTQLNAQRADGGGDYPEAVHEALENIVQGHQWREDAVKLCFFVLDAPPHTESEIQGINQKMTSHIMEMAKQGIRLIPVASSGVNTETEFLLRSWAFMTGGTYTFLTDHSGIGNSHLEPTIGEFEVEKLNDLMVRLIKEYCGEGQGIPWPAQ